VKKRDRTSEEKQADKLMKTGVMALGTTIPPNPEDYRHRLRFDMMGRKGQPCRILQFSGTLIQIQFEDGYTALVRRTALRRRNDATNRDSPRDEGCN
jgi:hypothetical protein